MSDTWHGYPQHPDAHPERPWWRLSMRDATWPEEVEEEWVRTDGGVCGAVSCPSDDERVAMLDRYDAGLPLPCPPPMCGQVWRVDGLEVTIVRVVDGVGFALAPSPGGWTWGGYASASLAAVNASAPNAVLVAGPGAPWAPMGETDG